MASAPLRFLLDDDIISLTDIDPLTTVLDWLRVRRGRTGSKEGCAEGDCGACTVLVGTLVDDRVQWRALNACILFLPTLDGKALMTVESLKGAHPVQADMIRLHGAQCGFCTPGIIMSLVGRAMGAVGTRDADPADVLAGNLCRCTGYGPILDAANAHPPATRDDAPLVARLKTIARTDTLEMHFEDQLQSVSRRWTAPRSVDELAGTLEERPDARLVAGATDVGLWVTKQHRVMSDLIFISGLMNEMSETPDGLHIGAGVSYADAHSALARLHPDLGELVRRIGATQVRNAGTIGGNIANGSPIGDMPPALIALGATLILRRGQNRRTLNLEDYFLSYGVQDRQPGEFVESVIVPRPAPTDFVRIVKLSKRFDSDISAVCVGVKLRLDNDRITQARVAFGGMAGTPKRALAVETALINQPFSRDTLNRAADKLAEDFSPLTDVRGSREYRLLAAGNVLKRLWFDRHGPSETVLEVSGV